MISPSLGIYFWMIRAACPMVSRQLLESYIGQGGVVGLVLYMHIAQCAVHEGKHMSALQDTYTLRWTAKTATPIYVGHGCILVIRCTVRAAGCRLEDVTVSRVSAKYDMLQPTRGPLEWCQTSTSIHSNHDCLPIQGRFICFVRWGQYHRNIYRNRLDRMLTAHIGLMTDQCCSLPNMESVLRFHL